MILPEKRVGSTEGSPGLPDLLTCQGPGGHGMLAYVNFQSPGDISLPSAAGTLCAVRKGEKWEQTLSLLFFVGLSNIQSFLNWMPKDAQRT
jgi:hypothetical protein